VNVSGEVLHTLTLQFNELVFPGPDGHILLLAEGGFRVLDADFSELQMLSWQNNGAADQTPFWAVVGRNIYLTPSRQGFVIEGPYPDYGAAYFEGNPIKLVKAISPCSPFPAVADGGFGCFEDHPKSKLVGHLVDEGWDLEDRRLGDRLQAAFPTPVTLLLLTNKFKLYEFQRGRSAKELANLHWLAPGLLSRVSSFSLASNSTHRLLVSSLGCWLPITDSTGLGYYQRIVVLDYLSGAVIYRTKSSIYANIAISPDGRLLAISVRNRVSLVTLPDADSATSTQCKSSVPFKRLVLYSP
jgi:hypothetical protein